MTLTKGKVIGAALVPGLPHLLVPERSPAWASAAKAMLSAKETIEVLAPDVLVIFSSQWLSVLGTSVQAHPNPKGLHVDENWHDLVDLPFNFQTDAALASAVAESIEALGFPARTVAYDDFPIDTGTIVALQTLNSHRKCPVVVVSSWVYADAAKAEAIGSAVRKAIEQSGKRAFVIASTLLSARFFSDEIDPLTDHISDPGDDAWNRNILSALETGDFAKLREVHQSAGSVVTDMQFNVFYSLAGVLAGDCPGRIRHYGPLWGTGAAVVEFSLEEQAK
jgi:2-aminophenol/2-amino-5-chlorophenol 1,6-dioxygenase alpha subunit